MRDYSLLLILTWLPLSHSSLDKEVTAVAVEIMETNSTFANLYFFECHIDCANADTLAKGLKENSTLTKLTLSFNR